MTIAASWPQPAEILEYYQRSCEALNALKQSLVTPVATYSRFYSMTAEECEQAIRDLATELEHEVSLLLTASFEATFQVDFCERVSQRRKDPVSRQLRKLKYAPKRTKTMWITIEDILDVWQKQTGRVQVIGNLKQVIQFRHWLAHGRYWEQKSGLRDVDPFDTWVRGKAVFDVLPGFKPLASIS